jgi:hypothetical protein
MENNSLFEGNNSAIIKILLIFYLLIGNSALHPLLSKQWNKMLENNRLIQHLIGFITMITLVTLMGEGKMDNFTILTYSAIGYLWFIFSTKLDIHWNVIVMILLVIAYLYENSLLIKENESKSDKVLNDEEKNFIKQKNCSRRTYILLGILGVTLLGVFLYSHKKEVQYGGGYSMLNFLLY